MAFLHVAFLFMLTWNKLAAESEHVSINVPGDVPSISAEEAMRIPEEVEVEENLPMMFARASQPARYKYGGGAYSRKQQKAIVNIHNEYRRNVSPAPSDMSEMLWSPKLAAQAQAWSDRCVYAHPDRTQHPDYEGIGQNLYIKYLDTGGKSPPSPDTDPVTKWYDEVKDFHYDYNQCNTRAVCGHFTQVVWAKTTKVGCGITFCSEATSDSGSYPNAWLVTCNYSPAGNMVGVKPYKDGVACRECEKGFCLNKLCSKCKSTEPGCECKIQCENCGTEVAKTCSCNCQDGFYGSNCAQRCEDTNSYCGGNPGWPEIWCHDSRYPFVDEGCPKMCGFCQAGSGATPQC